MLQEVRQDLSDVVQVCEGKKKQTNYLRTLISDLVKGKLVSFFCIGLVLFLEHKKYLTFFILTSKMPLD